jgi:hypothetical protein
MYERFVRINHLPRSAQLAGPFLISLGLCACPKHKPASAQRLPQNTELKPQHPIGVRLIDRGGTGILRYLGWDVRPRADAHPGQAIEFTHYFEVETAVGRDLQLFLHGEVPGTGRVLVHDQPIGGHSSSGTSTWKAKERWAVKQLSRMPAEASGGKLTLYAGLFSGEHRLSVWGPPNSSDGQDRIKLGFLPLSGAAPSKTAAQGRLAKQPAKAEAHALPSVIIPRAKSKISADGRLDEADWKSAPVLRFKDTFGRKVPTRFPTKLRLLYDKDNLYVAFEAQDEDITCPYENRDDPTYDHEAVELFIMPNVVAPALGPYIELQASPKGIIFDAAFTGRRRGMDTRFNAGQTVGTHIDGTLNVDDQKDKGFVSEWIVPFAKMRGVKSAPKAGDEWRMNAFRIEKFRRNGQVQGEYTAWSPPLVGDFHNTEKFGRMKFGP